jgi:hypothetical protein
MIAGTLYPVLPSSFRAEFQSIRFAIIMVQRIKAKRNGWSGAFSIDANKMVVKAVIENSFR